MQMLMTRLSLKNHIGFRIETQLSPEIIIYKEFYDTILVFSCLL